jgi:hypothetical protein
MSGGLAAGPVVRRVRPAAGAGLVLMVRCCVLCGAALASVMGRMWGDGVLVGLRVVRRRPSRAGVARWVRGATTRASGGLSPGGGAPMVVLCEMCRWGLVAGGRVDGIADGGRSAGGGRLSWAQSGCWRGVR